MHQRLDGRRLNRATLARQHLLGRVDGAERRPLDVVRDVVGLQGQDPDPPYLMLWNRIEGFTVEQLTALQLDRSVVRATLFRGTLHLVATDDYLWLRPMLQPMLERWQRGAWGKTLEGVDVDELAKAAADLLDDGRLTRPRLSRALAARWPEYSPTALARSVQGLLPVVHPPPDGLWHRHGPAHVALAHTWLGRPLSPGVPPSTLVRRYLAAFGPATVKDVQAWSGLTRLREVVEAMRPYLVTFTGEHGEELFDVPDAPRPDPETPAPARLLAPLDNVVLAYADRSRLVGPDAAARVGWEAAVLIDGEVGGFWTMSQDDDAATLTADLLRSLTGDQEAELEAEAAGLLAFAAPEAGRRDVRLRIPAGRA
ncbi:winged helix DNA-binding domain-containing protein [Jiangella aurantiaca]|uniref:Winged helix DNA-binding domain-containing protein n=1 Tax=Jiangella aurantiaca TaxID=2530373 RepID=A0A4R5A2R2_9ACTN|nr:winged helix DNA-binding domain-containing protein [Jiangella aurantiaca]TDD64849.1 winged helix DNA-binding domain-containing protein [Jiangella aurantiaca]